MSPSQPVIVLYICYPALSPLGTWVPQREYRPAQALGTPYRIPQVDTGTWHIPPCGTSPYQLLHQSRVGGGREGRKGLGGHWVEVGKYPMETRLQPLVHALWFHWTSLTKHKSKGKRLRSSKQQLPSMKLQMYSSLPSAHEAGPMENLSIPGLQYIVWTRQNRACPVNLYA